MTKSTAIVPSPSTTSLAVDAKVREKAREAMLGQFSRRTRKIYGDIWKEWERWAVAHGTPSLPAVPEALLTYLMECADGQVTGKALGLRSMELRRSAINTAHRMAGIEHRPCDHFQIRQYLTALAKTLPDSVGKAAATTDEIQAMLAQLGRRERSARTPSAKLVVLRDRALLLVGFVGCLRRSELVSVRVEDIHSDASGVKLYIPHSKTDQKGAGAWVGLEVAGIIDPVKALREWLVASGIKAGYVFRDVRGRHPGNHLGEAQVAELVKELAAAAGLDPGRYNGWSAHSLRAGLATQLLEAGVEGVVVAARGRWESLDMLKRYYRPKSPLNPAVAAALQPKPKERKGS